MNAILEELQTFYQSIGISRDAGPGDLVGGIAILVFILFSFKKISDQAALRKKNREELSAQPDVTPLVKSSEEKTFIRPEVLKEEEIFPEKIPERVPEKIEEEKVPWMTRLKKGLSRSRLEIWGKLESIVSGEALSHNQLEKVEEVLYSADMGPTTVNALMEELKKNTGRNFQVAELKNFLFQFLLPRMEDIQGKVDKDLYQFSGKRPGSTKVIMVVGVNGAGKTTTIGKLATKLTRQGAKVLVGACDTFRAAAVDQLEVWCKRAGAEIVRAKEGSDPSGVAYEALQKAKSLGADYCILDTAGRLHTKTNLMEELKKGQRVLSKLDDQAPHHVLLVIDAITGQNALKQAREFHRTLGLTGLVFTKCDGSAKAGNAVSIVQELQVPMAYIGVGEDVEDLNAFELKDYLKALLDLE